MISAAEVSADLHASYLARELHDCKLFGMGGSHMKDAGVDVRLDITGHSSVGIIEALKHIPIQLSAFSKMKALLIKEKPDALILVDAQGFNMPLAKFARSKGIKTIYYISPQEWLWGTEKGIKNIAKNVDLVISIFKKEHEKNIAGGVNSVYYGHPLLDIVKPKMTRSEFCTRFGLDQNDKIIALCPGSRPYEIEILLPILKGVAEGLKCYQLIMPIASPVYSDKIQKFTKEQKMTVKVIQGYNFDCLKHSDLVIAKSGTVVLETVILGTPVIMFYKLTKLTYMIAKYLMKIRLPFYSMPNLLANELIVPEYVMDEATPENILMAANNAINDPTKITSGYKKVIEQLGEPGAVNKIAQKIKEFIKNKH